MKRLLVFALIVLLSGCADGVRKNGKKYAPYGVLNQNTAANVLALAK